MARNFRAARQMHKLKMTEAAGKLGVSQPTLSAWETGRKAPGIESLETMADFYGVTTDYLLGRETASILNPTDPITPQSLPVFQGRPVWSAEHGWMLVNAVERVLTLPDGSAVPFERAGKVYAAPLPFADAEPPHEKPLLLDTVIASKQVWVEPISPDSLLRNELRGLYTVYPQWAENDRGNRFFFDSYGAKWLAYSLE